MINVKTFLHGPIGMLLTIPCALCACVWCVCRRCAMISAHNSFSDVFDNLVISLFKFTTLLSANEVCPITQQIGHIL